MTILTATGFNLPTFDQIKADITARLQQAYGANIDLSDNSPDGQFVALEANAFLQLYQELQAVYNGFNPNLATGIYLDQLVRLNGLTRRIGTKTSGQITISGAVGTTIPVGSKVGSPDLSGITFSTTSQVIIAASGAILADVACDTIGAVLVDAGKLTNIITPIAGWQTCTNALPLTTGSNTETDGELRIRRAQSTSFPATSTIDSLVAKLLATAGITKVSVYEDTVNKLIIPYINGGSNADIANVLWVQKGFGQYSGSISYNILDSQGVPHTMRFSRPNSVPLYVAIRIAQLPNYNSNTIILLQNALYNYINGLLIGDDVLYFNLLRVIADAVGGYNLTTFYFGKTANPTGNSDIAIASNELATLSIANIQIVSA